MSNKKLIIQAAKDYLRAKQRDKVAYYIALGKLVGLCEAFDLVFYDNNDTIILYRKRDRRTVMQVVGRNISIAKKKCGRELTIWRN